MLSIFFYFQASKKRERDPMIDAITNFGRNMMETLAQKKTMRDESEKPKETLNYETTWRFIESLFDGMSDRKIRELELKLVGIVMEAAHTEDE